MFIQITKMLNYDRIEVFQGIGVNKTGASKECDISYGYFLGMWKVLIIAVLLV